MPKNIYTPREELVCGKLDAVNNYHTATPLPKKATYVIDAVSMMKGLIERGYVPNSNGDFVMTDNVTRRDYIFSHNAWFVCGNRIDKDFGWEPWMIEEVEI